MATITNAKEFSAKLRGFKTSSNAIRENLQALLEYGFQQYKDHQGNATPLTEVMQVVSEVRTVPAKTIKAYIGAHANVAYIKNKKTGAMVFRKNGQEVVVTMPETPWYAHEANKANDAMPDLVDPVAILQAALTKVAKAFGDDLIPESRKEFVHSLRTSMKDIMAMDKLNKTALKRTGAQTQPSPAAAIPA